MYNDLISRFEAIEAIASVDETNGTEKVFSGRQINTILSNIPSAAQVTSKLKKPCDSLLTGDSGERKEQKSKLEQAAEFVKGYTEWLEKLVVDSELFEWLCGDMNDPEWCEDICRYSSIQSGCLRHLYETISKTETVADPKTERGGESE